MIMITKIDRGQGGLVEYIKWYEGYETGGRGRTRGSEYIRVLVCHVDTRMKTIG